MRVVAVYIMFADNNGAESVLCSQYIDQHIDKDSRRVDPQEQPHTDLEHQAAFEEVQLGIASRMKRRERHLVFELSRPLKREQAHGLMSMRKGSSRVSRQR